MGVLVRVEVAVGEKDRVGDGVGVTVLVTVKVAVFAKAVLVEDGVEVGRAVVPLEFFPGLQGEGKGPHSGRRSGKVGGVHDAR